MAYAPRLPLGATMGATSSTGATTPLAVIARTLRRWRLRAHQRRELLTLDDRMLADIGLSRSDGYREGTKPFWRA